MSRNGSWVTRRMHVYTEVWMNERTEKKQGYDEKNVCRSSTKILYNLQIDSMNIFQLQSEPGSGSDIEGTNIAGHTTGGKN